MQMLDGRVAPVAPRRAPFREGVEECGRWRRGRRGDLARGVLQEGRRAGPGPKRGEGGWKLEVLGARGFLCARHPLLVAESQLPPGAVAPAVAHAGRPAGRACPDTAGSGFGTHCPDTAGAVGSRVLRRGWWPVSQIFFTAQRMCQLSQRLLISQVLIMYVKLIPIWEIHVCLYMYFSSPS